MQRDSSASQSASEKTRRQGDSSASAEASEGCHAPNAVVSLCRMGAYSGTMWSCGKQSDVSFDVVKG